jgi:copper chaperone CopZ
MIDHNDCHVPPIDKPLQDGSLVGASAAYLTVTGLGCDRCAARVRNGLLAQDGVLLADVFLEHGVAAVAFDPTTIDVARLLAAVSGAGNDGRHEYRALLVAVEPVANVLDETALVWDFARGA